MIKRFIALLIVVGVMAYLAVGPDALAQIPQEGLTVTACKAANCCVVAPPANGTNSTLLYGFHVSNANASPAYVQIFNTLATPTASATPIGGASWYVTNAQDRDIQVGGDYGWIFNTGIMACCSSAQATFTGVNCNFLIQSR